MTMTSKYLSSVYKRQGIGTAILLIGLVLLALLSASCGPPKAKIPAVVTKIEVGVYNWYYTLEDSTGEKVVRVERFPNTWKKGDTIQ